MARAGNGGDCWELFVDGSSIQNGAGAGLLLISPEGEEYQYGLTFGYHLSNNAAEYEALIAGLEIAIRLKASKLKVFTDSQLVAKQVLGEYSVKEAGLVKCHTRVQQLWAQFKEISIQQIPREQNSRADALSKLASSNTAAARGQVFMEFRPKPQDGTAEQVCEVEQEEACWKDEIEQYLREGKTPSDPKERAALQRRSARYLLLDGKLFRKSFSGPMLRCVGPTKAAMVLSELHEGVCGNHTGGRSLAQKTIRLGYYWPTLKQDALTLVRRCEKCQKFAKVPRRAPEELGIIRAPWPFAMWGLDLIGPLPLATGQRKFVIVACDYFTKWVEAEPLASITQQAVEQFLWKNILCRFGIPHVIVSDNGLQLRAKHVVQFCHNFGIKMIASSVMHPQTNGQVEAANGNILKGMKKKLGEAKGNWVDILADVLWGIRTDKHSGTGETPYNLVYGTEAVLPVEMGVHTLRTGDPNLDNNEAELRTNLDLLEEVRLNAKLRQANRSMQVSRYFNKKVNSRQFQEGDFVLRNCEASRPPAERKKLSENWEGPYRVSRALGKGAYKLTDMKGKQVPRTWNAAHLKKFYV